MKSEISEELLRVYDEYRGNLEIPTQRNSKPYLIAPIGLTGAGKTTTINKLSKKIPLVVISGDEIRRRFKECGVGFDEVYFVQYGLAKEFIRKGYNVGIDADCASAGARNEIDTLEQETQAQIIWIHIDTPEQTSLKNIKNRGETIFGASPEAMVRAYHRRKEKYHREPYQISFTCLFSGDKEKTDAEIEKCVPNITTT